MLDGWWKRARCAPSSPNRAIRTRSPCSAPSRRAGRREGLWRSSRERCRTWSTHRPAAHSPLAVTTEWRSATRACRSRARQRLAIARPAFCTDTTMSEPPLLEVRDLSRHFNAGGSLLPGHRPRRIQAVDGVSFDLAEGETLGLVGESGCGKSTLGRLILRLIEPTAGAVLFEGRDVTQLSGQALRETRRRIQMVFQDPYSSLDPRMRIGTVIREPLDIFRVGTGPERRRRVGELLERVGLDAGYAARFPHELS